MDGRVALSDKETTPNLGHILVLCFARRASPPPLVTSTAREPFLRCRAATAAAMGEMDSTAQWANYQAALKRGPAPTGAYNNTMGFDQYAKHAQVDYRDEVYGVLVGYAGHVPRARDKVGNCPLGNTPGTPQSPNGAVGVNLETGIRELPEWRPERYAMSYKKGSPDPANKYTPGVTSAVYTSEARDPQNSSNKMKPKMFESGTTPGYTGHVPRVKTHSLGSTTHSTPPPGSSSFIGKFEDQKFLDVMITIKPRTNKAGHHAMSGSYMLATVSGHEGQGQDLLCAIDEKAGHILVDFSPKGGPSDYKGVMQGKTIVFPNGMKWDTYTPPTTFVSAGASEAQPSPQPGRTCRLVFSPCPSDNGAGSRSPFLPSPLRGPSRPSPSHLTLSHLSSPVHLSAPLSRARSTLASRCEVDRRTSVARRAPERHWRPCAGAPGAERRAPWLAVEAGGRRRRVPAPGRQNVERACGGGDPFGRGLTRRRAVVQGGEDGRGAARKSCT